MGKNQDGITECKWRKGVRTERTTLVAVEGRADHLEKSPSESDGLLARMTLRLAWRSLYFTSTTCSRDNCESLAEKNSRRPGHQGPERRNTRAARISRS